jgi:hypothetical protein
MKESKFIELLNLYVDQQIEPADAALLEAEILRNPARRQVYQQYCRMQRACALIVEQAQPEVNVGAKLADTVAAADEKVMEFPVEESRRGRVIYFGGLVAACIAVVFMVGRVTKPSPATAAVSTSPEQVVQIMPAAFVKDSATSGLVKYQPVLVTHSLRLSSPAAAPTSPTGDQLSLDWINQVKFSPVSISNEELALGNQSGLKTNPRDAQQRVFQNGLPTKDPQTEQAAYRFQR